MEEIKVIAEMSEGVCEAQRYLILSQNELENGNLAKSQQMFLQAKNVLQTLIKDNFVEVDKLDSKETHQSEYYDISVAYLIYLLAELNKTAAAQIVAYADGADDIIKNAYQTTLEKIMNSVEELFNMLFM